MFDFSAEATKRSVEKSLQKLGLEYVDIIQVKLIRITIYMYKLLLSFVRFTTLNSLWI